MKEEAAVFVKIDEYKDILDIVNLVKEKATKLICDFEFMIFD